MYIYIFVLETSSPARDHKQQDDPDDERGANNLDGDKHQYTNVSAHALANNTDGRVVLCDSNSTFSSEDDSPLHPPAKSLMSFTNLVTNNEKRRRKRKTRNAPLEVLECRGVCGSGLNCLFKASCNDDTKSLLLHCANAKADIQCPLWVGGACAEKYNNYKCRICSLLDNDDANKTWYGSLFLLNNVYVP